MTCECMAINKAEMTYEQLNAANNSACNKLAVCKEKLFNRRSEVTRLSRQLAVAVSAIELTLSENADLSDGDNCTLIRLKQALKLIRDIGEGTV